MDPHLYLAFVVTVAILIAVPGPIVSIVVANALSDGAGSGLRTAVGAGIGNATLLGALEPAGRQLFAMSATMVLLGLCSDGLYALLAGRARAWLADPARRRLHDRINGSVLIGVGLGLLLVRHGA